MKKLFSLLLMLSIVFEGLYAQTRVTGGFPINITAAPWQVILKVGNTYACGGSIIAPNFILTAKHCVNGVSPHSIQVDAGITCKDETNNSNVFNVSEIILHPTLDVALLRLSRDIAYNNSKQAIDYLNSTDPMYYNVGKRQ